MDSDPELSNIVIQIRNKLQKSNIKLWNEPYYKSSDGASEEDLKKLAQEFCCELKLPFEKCYSAIIELQNNALNKLKSREEFKKSGIATLKIKSVGEGNINVFLLETHLSVLGSELKNLISAHLKISVECIKMIASGKIIKETEKLEAQGIRNGQNILVIFLNESLDDIQKSYENIKDIENIKADAKLLLKEDDGHYLELEDQHGNKVNIPIEEKKKLILAMTLYEKGRSFLKKNNYPKALLYFLDADNEFKNCNSSLLNSVDNYALLDLDIAWCYLCLQSVSHIPEAYERLNRCEQTFFNSYGTNFERLIALKGTAVNEAALLLRLHLLQAIVLFHQNKRAESKLLLKKVEEKLKELKVDENKIFALTELGYSIAEARVALRANHGDLSLAANFINDNRERKAEIRKKNLTQKILERERKKLGKCADGEQYVDPNFLKMLINMGFNKEMAILALKKCNNVLSAAVEFIHDNPSPGPSSSISQEMLKLINDLTPELESAGFDSRMAKLALKKHEGDILKAAEELIDNDGIIEGDVTIFEDIKPKKSRTEEEEVKKREEAYGRLKEDICEVEEDYLDLTLEEEEIFLNKYLSLLENDE